MLPAHSALCSPCWQARHSVRTPPSFSWRRADAVIRWSLGWPPPDTRHTIQMSESASVTCCSSISRAGLMISRCRLYLLATFSRAVSNTTCSKSCKQNPWTNIEYQTENFSLCLLTISNSSNWFSYLETLEHIPGIEHFSDGVVSLLYHHWSY